MKRIANITIWAAAGWLLMAGQAWALDLAGIYSNSATQQDHQVNGWSCDRDNSEAAVQVRIKIWKTGGGVGACNQATTPHACVKVITWANVAHGGTGNACGGTTDNHGFRYTITAADKAFLGPGMHQVTTQAITGGTKELAYSPKDITWDPRGAMDAPSGTTVTGWACDADDPDQGVYPAIYVGGHPDTCNPGVDCYEVSNIAFDLMDTRGQACGGTNDNYGWRWNPSQGELNDIGAVIGFGAHNVYALGFNLGTYGDDMVFGPQSITLKPPKPWQTNGVITAATALNKSNVKHFLFAVQDRIYRQQEDTTAGEWTTSDLTAAGPWASAPAVDGKKPLEGAGVTAMWFDDPYLYLVNEDRYWKVSMPNATVGNWTIADSGLVNESGGPLNGAPSNTASACSDNVKPWSGDGVISAWMEPHDGKEYLTVVNDNCYWRKNLTNSSWTQGGLWQHETMATHGSGTMNTVPTVGSKQPWNPGTNYKSIWYDPWRHTVTFTRDDAYWTLFNAGDIRSRWRWISSDVMTDNNPFTRMVTLKIATFNGHDKFVSYTTTHRNNLADWVEKHQLDVLALQEVESPITDVNTQLSGYSKVGGVWDPVVGHELQILARTQFSLGSHVGPSGAPWNMHRANISTLAGTVRIYNGHPGAGTGCGYVQTSGSNNDLVDKLASSASLMTLATGDFNLHPNSGCLNPLETTHISACVDRPDDTSCNDSVTNSSTSKIDYVWYDTNQSSWSGGWTTATSFTEVAPIPSDHRPVIVGLFWEAPTPGGGNN